MATSSTQDDRVDSISMLASPVIQRGYLKVLIRVMNQQELFDLKIE